MRNVPQDAALETLPSLQDIQNLRRQFGAALNPTQAIAMWDVGAKRSTLLISEGDVGHPIPVLHHMQIGTRLLVQRTFKKSMPTALQLEQAIMLAEDAIMPLARLFPVDSILLSHDPMLISVAKYALPQIAPNSPCAWTALHREAVETLFQQLVQQAQVPHRPLPTLVQSPPWAAALLLLREALHHWHMPCMWVPMTSVMQTPKAAA